MDWSIVPWGAVVTAIGMIVGSIVWLVRLEARANTASRDIDSERASRKESDRDLQEKVTLTNARISVVESTVTEVRVTAVTRDDLREVEQRVTKSIDGLGDRLEQYLVDRTSPRAAARTRKPGA